MSWTIEEYHAWQAEMLEDAGSAIGKALNALPREYASYYSSPEVGGNLHSALGFLVAVRSGIRDNMEEVLRERQAEALEGKPAEEESWVIIVKFPNSDKETRILYAKDKEEAEMRARQWTRGLIEHADYTVVEYGKIQNTRS